MYSWSKLGIPCLALSRARLLRTQTAICHCIAWMTLYNVYVTVSSLHEFVEHPVQNQPTRELISTQKTSHRHSKDLSPTVTLPWHACKYKVCKLHQWCILMHLFCAQLGWLWSLWCCLGSLVALKTIKKIFLCLFLFITSIRDCLSMCHEHSFLFDVWSTLQTDNLPHHQI